MRTTRKRPDADQTHDLRRRDTASHPTEKLDQIQLIEEVVLVPQNDLVMVAISDDAAPSFQVVDDF